MCLGTFSCDSIIRVNDKFGPPEFPQFITTKTAQSCTWIYYGGPRVQLRLLYFDLPESEGCAEGSLRLYRGLTVDERRMITTPLCGHVAGSGRVVSIDTTYFVIELRLEGRGRDGQYRGFHGVMEPT